MLNSRGGGLRVWERPPWGGGGGVRVLFSCDFLISSGSLFLGFYTNLEPFGFLNHYYFTVDKYQFRPCLKEGSGISRTLVYVDAYIWRRTGVADQTHLRGRGYRWFGSIGGSTPFASR